MDTTGKRIKRLRQNEGISQETLSYALGVARQTVSNWENDLKAPGTESLSLLSDHFKVDVNYLLCKTPNPQQVPTFYNNYPIPANYVIPQQQPIPQTALQQPQTVLQQPPTFPQVVVPNTTFSNEKPPQEFIPESIATETALPEEVAPLEIAPAEAVEEAAAAVDVSAENGKKSKISRPLFIFLVIALTCIAVISLLTGSIVIYNLLKPKHSFANVQLHEFDAFGIVCFCIALVAIISLIVLIIFGRKGKSKRMSTEDSKATTEGSGSKQK